jgi:hypothetical protein
VWNYGGSLRYIQKYIEMKMHRALNDEWGKQKAKKVLFEIQLEQ